MGLAAPEQERQLLMTSEDSTGMHIHASRFQKSQWPSIQFSGFQFSDYHQIAVKLVKLENTARGGQILWESKQKTSVLSRISKKRKGPDLRDSSVHEMKEKLENPKP